MSIDQKLALEMLEITNRHLRQNPEDCTPNAHRFAALCRVKANGGEVSDKAHRFMQDYVYDRVK